MSVYHAGPPMDPLQIMYLSCSLSGHCFGPWPSETSPRHGGWSQAMKEEKTHDSEVNVCQISLWICACNGLLATKILVSLTLSGSGSGSRSRSLALSLSRSLSLSLALSLSLPPSLPPFAVPFCKCDCFFMCCFKLCTPVSSYTSRLKVSHHLPHRSQ